MSTERIFGTACAGHSAIGGVRTRCKVTPRWITTQETGANPIYACGRHIAWVLALRTVPGASITVTQTSPGASS